ncbi:hypothetical protein GGQ97_002340 [Sphingomonas kaistensis]|uniref:Uncharacterized protein n=1 Tax=Sphingomonas kaistensis TaxID=298708 RepID=A0A7X6BHW4_9SPHN|nr:hypothetical protein [Sphingomonas kaistensis]NJC06547.1 hypothetical protein [Sphingomonas kaistensis]
MNDMSSVIVPKSDQINADDLLAGPLTFTIREVQIRGGQEQPVNILLEGTDKAFRPCKSMSRVLVQAWGPDASKYAGRALTLYRDPTVKWAGMEVGGIRISHMSHIDAAQNMMLTATKGSRKPHRILPLQIEQKQTARQTPQEWLDGFTAKVAACTDLPALGVAEANAAKSLEKLAAEHPDLHQRAVDAVRIRGEELAV